MKNKNVTVFGGNGFLGHQVVQRLAQQGCRIRVAVRDTDEANALKVYGDVGQIMPVQVFLTDQKAIESVCQGAHSVINLTGRLYEKRRSTFKAVHVEGAEAISKACAQARVQKFVHISALGSDVGSQVGSDLEQNGKISSTYMQSKALGENKVRKFFPAVTVVRPSLMFGPGDRFFTRFADLATVLPFMALFQGGNTKYQPVYVGDVAQAIIHIIESGPKTSGKNYDLAGPKVYTFKKLMELILEYTGRRKIFISIPSFVASVMAKVLQFMPDPLLTPDQLKLLAQDNVLLKRTKGLKDLGIEAAHLEAVVPAYLSCYKARF